MSSFQTYRTLLVTYIRPNGERGSMAADLAGMLADSGKRTALIDADLRQPSLHTLYNLTQPIGLSDLLTDHTTPDKYLYSVNGGYLDLMPAGHILSAGDTLATLSRMGSVMRSLKERYERVIIHGPSCINPEVLLLADLVDAVILLIHNGHNSGTNDQSRTVIDQLQKSGKPVIGLVMRAQPKLPPNQTAFLRRLLSYDRRVRSETQQY